MNYTYYSYAGDQKKENIYYHRRVNAEWKTKHKCSYWEFLVVSKGMLLNCVNECVNILYGNDIALVRSFDVHDVLLKDGHSFEYINIMIEDCYVKRILDYIDSDLYEKFKSEKYLQYSFPKEFILEIEEVINRADVTESDKERQILLKPLVLKLFAEFAFIFGIGIRKDGERRRVR